MKKVFLCEQVVESDVSSREKLIAIRDEFRLIIKGVYCGVNDGWFNIWERASSNAIELVGEIDYMLRHYEKDRLKKAVNIYDGHLFALSKRAYEG